MSTDNPGIKEDLRTFYDRDVGRRKEKEAPEWKIDHRSRFLNRCQESGCKRLLEVGSGPGRDGSYFADSGIDQVPIDLSFEMTRECSKEGLSPVQMDTYNLGFSENTFDCVWSLNVLLNVPKASIESVWREIHRVMKPGAIFFRRLRRHRSRRHLRERLESSASLLLSVHRRRHSAAKSERLPSGHL